MTTRDEQNSVCEDTSVRDRLAEIQDELRQSIDVDHARGEFLDMWGRRVERKRCLGEPDAPYRVRIKEGLAAL